MAKTAEEVAKDIAEAAVAAVKAQVGDFLEEHADAKAFVEDRLGRLAELAVALVKAGADETARKAVLWDISLVRQSIENELAGVAVAASRASRNLFKAVLNTAADILVKAAPKLLALL